VAEMCDMFWGYDHSIVFDRVIW